MVWTITNFARIEQNCGKHLKGSSFRAVTRDSRFVTREGNDPKIGGHGYPKTRSRKPGLRAIVIQEKWRRGIGTLEIARSRDGLGEFYD